MSRLCRENASSRPRPARHSPTRDALPAARVVPPPARARGLFARFDDDRRRGRSRAASRPVSARVPRGRTRVRRAPLEGRRRRARRVPVHAGARLRRRGRRPVRDLRVARGRRRGRGPSRVRVRPGRGRRARRGLGPPRRRRRHHRVSVPSLAPRRATCLGRGERLTPPRLRANLPRFAPGRARLPVDAPARRRGRRRALRGVPKNGNDAAGDRIFAADDASFAAFDLFPLFPEPQQRFARKEPRASLSHRGSLSDDTAGEREAVCAREETNASSDASDPSGTESARDARLRRNRASAAASRSRKRAQLQTLARRVRELERANEHLTYAAQCAHAENAALRARLGFPPVGAVPNPSLAAPQAPFLSCRRNPRATTPDDFATATPNSTSPPHDSFSPRVNTNSVPTNDDAAEPAALERGHGARDSGRRRMRFTTRRPSRADALDFRSMPFGGDDARRRRTLTERRTKTFARSGRRRRRAYRHTPGWTSRRRNEIAFVHSVSRKGTRGGEGPAERPPAAALGREFAERTRSASLREHPSRVAVAADELKNVLLASVPRPAVRAFPRCEPARAPSAAPRRGNPRSTSETDEACRRSAARREALRESERVGAATTRERLEAKLRHLWVGDD